jgi:hypothetical protein
MALQRWSPSHESTCARSRAETHRLRAVRDRSAVPCQNVVLGLQPTLALIAKELTVAIERASPQLGTKRAAAAYGRRCFDSRL